MSSTENKENTRKPGDSTTDIEMGGLERDESSLRRITSSGKQIHFGFRDVSFRVKGKTSDSPPKTILNGVSGSVRGGEVLGVLGPSGSGKTSLLDLLADRLAHTHDTDGDVIINGAPRDPSVFMHQASYVPQEDHLMGTMTARETLAFAASLTIPEQSERAGRCRDVLEELGLADAADVRVGTVFQKGMSGGQKRRLSMGVELLQLPDVLFLDEPTSGLDSASALSCLDSCRRVAETGRAVIATIHQPSSDVFRRLDKVMLLSRGRVVYFGRADAVIDYFNRANHPAPEHTNPADHIVSVINTDYGTPEERGVKTAEVERLVELFRDSPEHRTIVDEISAAEQQRRDADADGSGGSNKSEERRGFVVGYGAQFATLAARSWQNNIRNPGIFGVRLVMYTMLSVMLATMYVNIDNGQLEVSDRLSVLFFTAAFMVFMSVAAIPFFIETRSVFLRERSNGWYSVGAYVAADFVTGVPGIFAIAFVSTIITYFAIGFADGGFGVFLADLFVVLLCAESFVLFVSATVPYYIIAMALAAGAFGLFMLVQGFFVVPSNLPAYYAWISPLTFHYWAFRVFVYNEFDGLDIKCDRPVCQWGSGQDVLVAYEMDDVNVGLELGILAIMSVAWRFFFFLVLYVFHKGRR